MSDVTNKDRSEWALQAVEAFQVATGTEDEHALADLLCDLMHLHDERTEYATGRSWEEVTSIATGNYIAEVSE
jgi:hypothetical protein